MDDDWFRCPDWSEEAQADFERRLGRARSHSRAQYLRIKGLALEAAGEIDGARALWLRVLGDDGEYAALQQYGAMEHLGDSYAATEPELAEQYYRRLIAENPRLNLTTTLQYVKLAELLIRRGGPGYLDEASNLLVTWVDVARSPFPTAHFRWNLAVIELSEAKGDRDAAREAARRALDLASRGPVFSRHKTVGLGNRSSGCGFPKRHRRVTRHDSDRPVTPTTTTQSKRRPAQTMFGGKADSVSFRA